jgi:BolA family transcriptional regulator, general stress-responsive regulator
MRTLQSNLLEKRCHKQLTTLTDIIRERLVFLQASQFDISDQSAQHAGHVGNTGGGHFTLKIISSHFSQKSQIMRHRIIYQALNDLIPGRIHALSLLAIAPDDPK